MFKLLVAKYRIIPQRLDIDLEEKHVFFTLAMSLMILFPQLEWGSTEQLANIVENALQV